MARKGEEWTVVGGFILEDKRMDVAFIERSNYGEKKINFIQNKLNLDIQKLLCNEELRVWVWAWESYQY